MPRKAKTEDTKKTIRIQYYRSFIATPKTHKTDRSQHWPDEAESDR